MNIFNTTFFILFSCIFISCASGGGSDGGPSTDGNCDGTCANQNLLAEDVEKILSQAITSAKLQGVNATISVLDRVGNVLAIYQMPGSNLESLITGQIGATGGLEGLRVPASLVAISKAGTGAYLSSQGNAFSSRTAGHIVQEHFNPGEIGQVAGPLFGVQFSQLICSDVTKLDASTGGPRALPLGLSADPGGFPLYKSGDLVGGIGVEVDGIYTFDRNIFDLDINLEERIALEGSSGFHAPEGRKADKIFVGGKSLRYSDVDTSQASDSVLEVVDRSNLLKVPPFTDGSIKAGTIFTSLSSGVIRTSRAGLTTEVLVNTDGGFRYPSRDGSSLSGLELKANEVEALLNSAVLTSSRARAAIRRPLDTSARVSVWIVDHLGVPLGFARTMDAPVFGIDVALQKARTAAFFSSNRVRDGLVNAGFSDYLNRSKVLLGENAFSGESAFSNRAIGNISRPFFPDGIRENFPGSFSLPFSGTTYASGFTSTWSPFNTGLQLDLIKDAVLAPLSGVNPSQCTSQAFSRNIANGIQIFPGSVPLYRGTTLIGAIGVSGDGIDQDDLVAFYSASRQGLESVGQSLGDIDLGFNAPKELRSDKIPVNYENLRLRYVNCPEAPFVGSSEQGVCEGL
jgi:uncharacterized protein GlcG (DUF336 family)